MSSKLIVSMMTLFLSANLAFADGGKGQAQTPKGEGAPGPCKQIAEQCKSAGFVAGDWKKGDGLWRDCVDPIVQGKVTVEGATKPLPTVDPKVIAACKAKHPKFGAGKVGSKP